MRKTKQRALDVAILLMALAMAMACGGGQEADLGRAQRVASTSLNSSATYVNLFKWKWTDIATECTSFLGPQGFGAVQISPPAEHIDYDYWWNIYQPVNYTVLTSDMGTESDLQDMIVACHAAGVRIYADVVFNQMANYHPSSLGYGTGVAGTAWNSNTLTYGGGIDGGNYFHTIDGGTSNCVISSSDYTVDGGNRAHVVRCSLSGMPDLKTDDYSDAGLGVAPTAIAAYLQSLIDLGVDGFRIDAAKHMEAADIQAILASVSSTTAMGESLWITQEVIPDSEVTRSDYYANGTVNDFEATYAIRDLFRTAGIASLTTAMGTGSGGGTYDLLSASNASVFVDNHDTQRSSSDSLNYYTDSDGKYDLAVILLMGTPYADYFQMQSGFAFSTSNTNANAPYDVSPYAADGGANVVTTCTSTAADAGACGWDFVHRWPDLYPMVKFREAVAGTAMAVPFAADNQIAVNRGSVGFLAVNNDSSSVFSQTINTGLSAGTYCNVVHNRLNDAGTACVATNGSTSSSYTDTLVVDSSGNVSLSIPARSSAPVSAVVLYTGQKISAVADAGSVDGGSGSGADAGSSDAGALVSTYSAMYLRGTMLSTTWGAQAMALTASYTWQTTSTLSAGTQYQYKYEIGGGDVWSSNNWGYGSYDCSSTAATGTATVGTRNLCYTPSTSGVYVFQFNDSTLEYAVSLLSTADAGSADAGVGLDAGADAGVALDGGGDAGEYDAGTVVDAGSEGDAGVVDAGLIDAGTQADAGATDAGLADAGASDAGAADAGVSKAAAPTDVAATTLSTSEILVTWTASEGASSYRVYRATSSVGPFSILAETADTNYTDSGLTAKTTYYYYVRALNAAGSSGASTVVSARTVLESDGGTDAGNEADAGTNSVTLRGCGYGSSGPGALLMLALARLVRSRSRRRRP